MEAIILAVHLILAIAIVAVVLLQKSEGGALGIGGGGGGGGGGGFGLMSGRGAANLLTRTTAILAAAFMGTSIALAIMSGDGREPSALDAAPVPITPSAPTVPASPSAPPLPALPPLPAPGSNTPTPPAQ